MFAKRAVRDRRGADSRRRGAAAVEFAVALPLLTLILTGLWEVGRITEVQEVVWNSAREAARDASLGEDNLQAVATNLLTYLQSAEPTAFGKGHSTSMITPVVTLPSNTYGYTCWDNTANQELFTVTFSDITNPNITDPTVMSQLDVYQIGVQYPSASVRWSSVIPVAGMSRLYVSVVWASMVDSPFKIAPDLPAQ
jgi:Flp pilus assembly protein TadG